jgi:hypothetical protein
MATRLQIRDFARAIRIGRLDARSKSSWRVSVAPPDFSRLPDDLKAALLQIGAAGRGPLGRRNTQAIVTENLAVLTQLYRRCYASHADVAILLAAVGITRRDGRPLGPGTISSLLSRAYAAQPSRGSLSRNSAAIEKTRGRNQGAAQRADAPNSPTLQAKWPSGGSGAEVSIPTGEDSSADASAKAERVRPQPPMIRSRDSPGGTAGAASRRAGELLNQLAQLKGFDQ